MASGTAGSASNLGIGRLEHAVSLRDRVESAVGAAIISGEMPPGAVFSVPVLAAEFHVSATPVREAMLNLEHRGLVTAIRNKGFRVTDVDRDVLGRIVAVREYLEPAAMHDLAATFDKQDAPRFGGIADRIVGGAEQEDLASYLAADQEFHLGLLDLLGNRLLTSIVQDLRERTRLAGLQRLLHTDRLATSAAEHHQILALLVARDQAGVRALMHRHIGHIPGWWSGEEETAEASSRA